MDEQNNLDNEKYEQLINILNLIECENNEFVMYFNKKKINLIFKIISLKVQFYD